MMRIGMGLLALMGLGVAVSAQAQMTLPGKFEVTDTGSASYTIPISVVPGTAGLEPKLSLQYDSRSGNGLLGLGWSLAGLPAITRCGRTIAQDGVAGGVAFDANDRFCLDGQRLIATSGTYGADQTEYRTERESFSKVVSYGTAGSGPSWFKVWTKAGLVMEFGNTADAKIEAQGKSSVRVWALNKTSDTKGNYFTVSYTEDTANGGYQPSRIDYTGNGSTAPTNSVRFVYEGRLPAPPALPNNVTTVDPQPDATPAYHAGSRIQTTQRLAKVQAWQGNNLAREYRLSYEASPASRRSRLTSVTQCNGANHCLPATSFSWSDTGIPFTYNNTGNGAFTRIFHQTDANTGHFWATDTHPTFPLDVDGDGRTDFLQVGKTTDVAQVLRSNGDGTYTRVFHQTAAQAPFRQADGNPINLADVDGDGLTDVIQIAKSASSGQVAAQVLKSNGDGTFSQIYANAASPFWEGNDATNVAYAIDYNGDGRTDIIQNQKSGAVAQMLRSNGDGSFTQVFSQTSAANGPFRPANDSVLHVVDMDSDGRPEILVQAIYSYFAFILRANADATFAQLWAQPEWANNPVWRQYSGHAFPVDFGGDGIIDIAKIATTTCHCMEALRQNGDWTYDLVFSGPNQTYSPFMGLAWAYAFPINYNNDGKTDFLQIAQVASPDYYARLLYSRGNGTFDEVFYQSNGSTGPFWDLASYSTYPVDINGDGRTDIVQIHKYQPIAQVVSPAGGIPDLVKTVMVGQGTVTQIAYASLASDAASGSLYSRDRGENKSIWPLQDVAGGLQVVSEVKSSNGLATAGAGGEYRSTYRYAGAKSDIQGRGFLGFRQMTVRDEQTGVEQVTTYRQDYPFTGLVASREKKLGTQLLNRSTNTYDSSNLSGTRHYPFLTQSLEESWELTGAALPAVTTGYQYDAYGNATQVGVSTGDGYSRTTVNTYDNDAANWLLGRLTRSEVTSTTPGN